MAGLGGYLSSFIEAGNAARADTMARLEKSLGLYEQNIEMYQPGGEFGRGMEAQIGQAKKTSVSGGLAHLAKTGLYNTSIGAGLGTAFEKNVGTPARMQLNDMRMGHLSAARTAKAGVLERVNSRGPDPALLSNLMQAAANRPQFRAPSASASSYKTPSPWESDYMGGGWSIGSKGPSNVGGGTLGRMYG